MGWDKASNLAIFNLSPSPNTVLAEREIIMFDDQRSKKVLLVAHCVLNQSAKSAYCAYYPGVIQEVAEVLIRSRAGLVQMPCPETMALGLARMAEPGFELTVAEDDTRIAVLLQADKVRQRCRELADDIMYQIEEYQKNGFQVIGVLGMNGSPSCGVEEGWGTDGHVSDTPGILIQMLQESLAEKGMNIPMRGMRAYEIEKAVSAAKELLLLGKAE